MTSFFTFFRWATGRPFDWVIRFALGIGLLLLSVASQAQSTDPVSATKSSLSVSPFIPVPAGVLVMFTCIVKDETGRTIANSPVTLYTKPFQEVASGSTDNSGVFQARATANQSGVVTYYARAGTPPVELTQAVMTTYTTGFIRYVKADGHGDGGSWANASPDLQSQINAPGVQQVWVAAGTYKPTSTTARDISFSMKNGVSIYGGFSGTETSLGGRNVLANITSLSGDLNGDDGPDFANRSDNSYHVIFNNNLNNTARLDGFIITAGNASYPDNSGGAMYNVSSSPTLTNCSFLSNQAARNGGAMYNNGARGTSSPVVTNCSFQNNTAYLYGGAMYNDAYESNSSPVLTNCSFQNNTASDGGGQ